MARRVNLRTWVVISIVLMAVVSTASAKVIFVDANAPGPTHDGSSWTNAYKYLQDALAYAHSDPDVNEIWVAEGIYKPDQGAGITLGEREATFQLINGVTLKGGYASYGEPDPNAHDIELYETILSGDLDGNDVEVNDPCDLLTEPTRDENSYHVVTSSGTDPTAALNGVIVTGGNADGGYPPICFGGGMYNEYGSPTVINCTFSGNFSHNGGGMYNYSGSSTLTNCIFSDNLAGDGGGMLNDQSNIKLINCTFSGNSAIIYAGGGMYDSHSDSTVVNCTFSQNSSKSRGGGMHGAFSEPTLINCILWGNASDRGSQIGMKHDSMVEVSYCNVQGGISGVYLYNSSIDWRDGNIDADPCFADANNGDYHLRAGSMCINAGDPNYVAAPNEIDLDGKERVLGGRIDMGAYEYQVPIIYVDTNAPGPTYDGTSWANAYKYLQDGLTDAGSTAKPVEIRVAQGIYKPDESSADPNGSGDRTATFQLINNVAIKGGYAGFSALDPNYRDIEIHETTLSGDLDGDDADVNDPFDLQTEPTRAENSIHVVTGSGTEPNAVLDGFTITGGNANSTNPDHRGGGMFNRLDSSPTVTNCTFIANSATFRGGGMFNDDYSNPMVDNCTFTGNLAGRGGGMCNDEESTTTVINCIFSGNSAVYGGGMGNDEGCPIVINCTFVGNSANNGGGMEMSERGNAMITNCIFWANSPDQISLDEEGATASVTYTDVQGGWEGLGNIDVDPLFADPCDGDYHLKSEGWRWDANRKVWTWDDVTSQCIDAGNPGSPLGDEPVPNGNRRNMGAYGGTAESSKSPANWRSIADMTNDWILDFNDLKVFVSYWLETGECIPSDLNRNESVDFADFCIFAQQWSDTNTGKARDLYPADGAVINGYTLEAYPGYLYAELLFQPGPTAVKHTGYFSDGFADVLNRVEDANMGPPPWWLPYLSYAPGLPEQFYIDYGYTPPTAGLESLVRGTTYYWAIDEEDALGNIFPGDIWRFTVRHYKAFAPSPPNEAVFVDTNVLLSWYEGLGVPCGAHNVYIGTSWEDVKNATITDTTGIYKGYTLEPNYQCSNLAFDTRYYWRVDECDGRCPLPCCCWVYIKGDVWCFTTVPANPGAIKGN